MKGKLYKGEALQKGSFIKGIRQVTISYSGLGARNEVMFPLPHRYLTF